MLKPQPLQLLAMPAPATKVTAIITSEKHCWQGFATTTVRRQGSATGWALGGARQQHAALVRSLTMLYA